MPPNPAPAAPAASAAAPCCRRRAWPMLSPGGVIRLGLGGQSRSMSSPFRAVDSLTFVGDCSPIVVGELVLVIGQLRSDRLKDSRPGCRSRRLPYTLLVLMWPLLSWLPLTMQCQSPSLVGREPPVMVTWTIRACALCPDFCAHFCHRWRRQMSKSKLR